MSETQFIAVKCYVDVYGYDYISRQKNTSHVDDAVAYDNPQTGDTSVLLTKQSILSISMIHIYCYI